MLKGLGALGDIGKLMGQAQEMQAKMAELQERLETIEVEGAAGAGMVRAVCSAKAVLKSVVIDPSLMKPEEKQMVEDLVTAAFNDARDKADRVSNDEMQKIQGNMGLPPGFDLKGMMGG